MLKEGKRLEIKQFLSKTKNVDGCLVWMGFSNRYGYGIVSYRGKQQYSHRVSWIIHNGDIPDGMCVCHKCDNPSCVNPEHLFLGTRKDNVLDMVSKGRCKHGRSNSSLSEEDVIEIRRLSKDGFDKHYIAKKYKISLDNAYMVITGRSWKNI